MGSINVRGDAREQEEQAREIEWERNKLYIHLAARNNPGTFHWSLYLTEERPEVGWVYHVFDPEPDRWILEMVGGDGEGEKKNIDEEEEGEKKNIDEEEGEKRNIDEEEKEEKGNIDEEEKEEKGNIDEEEKEEKGNIDAGGGEDCSEGSELPGEESGGDSEQPIVDAEGQSKDEQEEKPESKKEEEKRKREARDTGHRSDETSDENEPVQSATSLNEQEEDRKHKKKKTVHWKDLEQNNEPNDPDGKPHDAKNDDDHTLPASSSLLAAVEIGTDVQDMRSIIEQTITTEWETGRKKIAKGEKICREFLLKCVEELESVGVLTFKEGKGVGDVEREAEEFGLLSDPALNKGARKGRVWKSRVVELEGE
ncbi:hypothetical protein BOTCAL_0039g00130 [Botryotinia calthae]|uniref:Uncharacterized protein n=1 Tax=Botryotinia calthae TaxID=38488 RepID=A0A4Y8DC54_9HELO|nr:hypothetical protein BOTCAL_0039g00130 [Botryotinia calthae]